MLSRNITQLSSMASIPKMYGRGKLVPHILHRGCKREDEMLFQVGMQGLFTPANEFCGCDANRLAE